MALISSPLPLDQTNEFINIWLAAIPNESLTLHKRGNTWRLQHGRSPQDASALIRSRRCVFRLRIPGALIFYRGISIIVKLPTCISSDILEVQLHIPFITRNRQTGEEPCVVSSSDIRPLLAEAVWASLRPQQGDPLHRQPVIYRVLESQIIGMTHFIARLQDWVLRPECILRGKPQDRFEFEVWNLISQDNFPDSSQRGSVYISLFPDCSVHFRFRCLCDPPWEWEYILPFELFYMLNGEQVRARLLMALYPGAVSVGGLRIRDI